MRRMWPEEFNAIISGAEEVMLETPAEAGEAPLQRKALKARITMAFFVLSWSLTAKLWSVLIRISACCTAAPRS